MPVDARPFTSKIPNQTDAPSKSHSVADSPVTRNGGRQALLRILSSFLKSRCCSIRVIHQTCFTVPPHTLERLPVSIRLPKILVTTAHND